MKKIQHFVSILLTACMILSLFTGVSLSAFAEENVVSLSFFNADLEALSGAPGDAVTLPAAEVIADGYKFLGWMDEQLADKTTAEPAYYPVGSSFTLPETDTELYPLFSFVDGRGTPTIDRYEKITSLDELKDGSYLIGVEKDGKLRAFDGSSANPNASGNYKDLDFAGSDFIACSADSDACAVSLTKLSDSDKYSFKMNNGTGKYIGSKGDTGMASRGTEPYPVCIDFDENGILVYYDGAEKDLYLGYYQTSSTQKFGFYNITNTSTTLADLYLRIDGIDGTLYYIGEQIPCDHEGTEGVVTEATCTEDGFTTYLCRTCGYKWEEEGTAAIGHDYIETLIEPTKTEEGYTLHECSVCGDSYTDQHIAPLGSENVISFYVLGNLLKTETYNSYQGVEFPDPDVYPDGYEFAGWSTDQYPEEVNSILRIETDPDDHKYHGDSVVLYAVYVRSEFVEGSGDYVKLTQMPEGGLNGKFLVVCEDRNIAFNSAFATTASNLNKAGNYLSVTISNHTIEATDELKDKLNAACVEIAPVGTTGNYSMKINSGLCIGSTGSSTANGINGKSGTVYQNTITISNGTAVIANAAATNTGSNTYNFAYNSSSVNRFAYCKPSTATVYPSSLYQKQTGTTTNFYTTAPATYGCDHEESVPYYTEPTCTEQGYITNVCTNCGYSWKDDFEDPLGHSYDEGVVTEPTPEQVGYTTYTCTVCGDKLIPEEEKVGFNFEITYNVLGTDRDPVIVNNNDGAEYPTDAPEIEGYKFIGWAEDEIIEEADKATVLTGRYIPTEDATLYAVYTRKEANTGDGNYYKVTSLPLVANGNYLIVDEGREIAFKAFEEDNEDYDLTKANNYITVEISNGMIEESSEADFASIVINPATNNPANYSMTAAESADGKTHYIGTTGSSTGMMENTKNPYPVTITFSDGKAVICNASGNTIYQLAYNTQSTSNKFGFFATTNKNADPVALYWKDGSGFTTYYTTRPINACTHENAEEVAATPATCLAPGYTAGVFCNDCQMWVSGHETVAALGHDYTCTDNGDTHIIGCSRCDYSAEEAHAFTDGVCVCGHKGLQITSAQLVLNGKLDLIYTASVPEGYEAPYMVFSGESGEVTVNDSVQDANGNYLFTYTGINPQCIGDNVSATLYAAENGKLQQVSKETYSVRQYCVNKLADEAVTGKLRTLLSDILAYGACSQIYMGYKTDSLVNTGDDIENPAYSTYEDLSGLAAGFEGDASEDVYWVGAGLTLTDSVAMTFRFYTVDAEELIITVKLGEEERTFTSFKPVEGKEGFFEITLDDINATQFGDEVTATFTLWDEDMGNTLSYSVNTYICSKQADSSEALANLVKALYNYGASAAAYAE